ncbi:DUF3142 domain-containing protein [Acinetobacter sp. MYb177]|uniref:DUF3142 domain-containing protein n=1 Tax=unclassified Acinetobacter TaxID=196816 RepID=UPI0030AE761D
MLKQIFSVVMTLICMLSIMACQPSQSASTSSRVNAEDYDAFWIWGNISSAPYLNAAKEIYVLQGEIRLDSQTRHSKLIPQGVSVLTIPQQKVWLVFRNYHLAWQGQELTHILKRVQQWENAGNHIQGIQIDFDAKTKHIHQYALFLSQLRKQLPQHYQLSITGLMDWTNVTNQETLNLLNNTIDELVIQTYQGSTTIPNYAAYLKKVSALKLPYKIGIVQHGQWHKPSKLENDTNFKGYVVFLLRSKPQNN